LFLKEEEMKKITVCTANMHNMFMLYKAGFKAPGQFHYEEVPKDFRYLPSATEGNQILSHPESRELAATALKRGGDNLPDAVIFQEVESMEALDLFNKQFLDDAYPYSMLVAGHYERLLNIGIMTMFPIVSVRSHKDEKTENGEYLFSRDCLEITLDVEGSPLTIFANHFKSRFGRTAEERDDAAAMRQRQGERVAEIVKEKFPGKKLESAVFAVVGDLNDKPDSVTLAPILGLGMEDVLCRLPEDERWTHYWAVRNIVSQFDYIMLSPALSDSSRGIPYIERRGLPTRGKEMAYLESKKDIAVPVDFGRFPEVEGKVFASDHAFIFFSVTLPH